MGSGLLLFSAVYISYLPTAGRMRLIIFGQMNSLSPRPLVEVRKGGCPDYPRCHLRSTRFQIDK